MIDKGVDESFVGWCFDAKIYPLGACLLCMSSGKVCIVGAGYMGSQIGVLCARSGYMVRVYDISREALQSSSQAIDGYLGEWVTCGVISSQDRGVVRERLSFHEDLVEAVSDSGMVIEAIVENLGVKRRVFRKLDEIAGKDAIIASNSSSIRISRIDDVAEFPERLLNMHFYSFPWRSRVLELMRGSSTVDDVVERAAVFARSIGVTPLIVLKESTGFIFNRIWRAVKRESLRVVDEGVASFMDVDRAWMSLYGTRVGPFGLMDRVGLDVVRDIELVYFEESGDPSDAPPGVLLDRIERGELGVKTGKGFYCYPGPCFEDPGWLHGE